MTQSLMEKPTVFVCYSNHFDLVWRRGWQTSYEYGGLTYRGYADVEDAVIGRWLVLATEQGAAFQIEQSLTMREYLRRHPESRPVFQQLAREGRFELLCSGEAIIDVNMCHGETMARNMASGVVYARELLGQEPTLACHADGFGTSAQFPQIVRGCGMRGIIELSYSKPDAPYWRGLDGSTVFYVDERPGKFFFYDHCYYEPCLICRGLGKIGETDCTVCSATGFRLSQGVYPPREDWSPDPNSTLNFFVVNSEEMLPDETLPAEVAAQNALGKAEWKWQTQTALLPLWTEALARVDEVDVPLSSRVENNPVQSATWVTRIRLKQAARAVESWFYAAEKLAVLASPAANKPELETVWLTLPMLFFHDAVNGTHIDPAHTELLGMAQDAILLSQHVAASAASRVMPGAEPIVQWEGAGQIAVFNPHSFPASLPVEVPAVGGGFHVMDAQGASVPVYRDSSQGEFAEESGIVGMRVKELQAVGEAHWRQRGEESPRTLRFLAANVPPLSTAVFQVAPAPPSPAIPLTHSAQAAGFHVGWDEDGVNSLVVQASGQELMPSGKGPLGHLILEDDRGDPWGTRYADRKRTSFAAETRLLNAEQRGGAVELTFGGRMDNGPFGYDTHPSVFGLEWLQTVRLLEGLPWVEVEMEIFWQAVDQRLRVAFPTRTATDRGLYHIPYGVLTRERYEMTKTGLWSPNGDWPALHFAATEPDGDVPGLAVFNTGTPSVRIEDGTLFYSILRSPGFGHCLNRYAQEYPMPVSEMRDGGCHRFRFAVMPYTGENLPSVLAAAAVLNSATPAFRVPAGTPVWRSGFALSEPGVSIAAIKSRFVGEGLALRVVEQIGQARTVTVTIPPHFTHARLSNLLEDPEEELAIQGGQVQVPVRAFGIYTLLLDSE